MNSDDQLIQVVRQWSTRPLPTGIAVLAEAARARHGGAAAVLFYGSCLREECIDEGIADLYLLVDNYHTAFRSHLQAAANRLLPPNVFYLEVPFEGKTLRAKYAILSLRDFQRGAQVWFHSYIWARFAQPSAAVYVRDPETAALIHRAQARAVRTFVHRTRPRLPPVFTARELWSTGLNLSYRCELRSERPGTAVRLFDAAPDFYETVTQLALTDENGQVRLLSRKSPLCYRHSVSVRKKRLNRLGWDVRQIQGKTLSVLRLLKGLFTFKNGINYILWKIERHSGVHIEAGPAGRRFPRLAKCLTVWKLFRKGAFR